jgi:hypothetical protein
MGVSAPSRESSPRPDSRRRCLQQCNDLASGLVLLARRRSGPGPPSYILERGGGTMPKLQKSPIVTMAAGGSGHGLTGGRGGHLSKSISASGMLAVSVNNAAQRPVLTVESFESSNVSTRSPNALATRRVGVLSVHGRQGHRPIIRRDGGTPPAPFWHYGVRRQSEGVSKPILRYATRAPLCARRRAYQSWPRANARGKKGASSTRPQRRPLQTRVVATAFAAAVLSPPAFPGH